MSEEIFLIPGIENGVYSYREAGAIISANTPRVARWADGYTYQRKFDRGVKAPILQTSRSQKVLTFFELIELLFVKEYTQYHVKLETIRSTAKRLAESFGPYPFANAQLYIAGKDLLAPYEHGQLVRPDIGQFVADFAFEKVKPRVTVDPVRKLAIAYSPPGYDSVWLNATIRGGEPTVSNRAVPTRAIYKLWLREEDIAPVQSYFDIDEKDVKAAIEFESNIRFSA